MFLFESNALYTHMPFLIYNKKGSVQLFCCVQNIDRRWKVCYKLNNTWKRLNTKTSLKSTLCGPTAYILDDIYHISFIAGNSRQQDKLKLYRMVGLNGEVEPVCLADVGYIYKNIICHANRCGPILMLNNDMITEISLPKVAFLYRLSYNPDNPDLLLISGQYYNLLIFSWKYDIKNNKLFDIKDGNTPAYKAAFLDGLCYYALRIALFLLRHIVKAVLLNITQLNADLYIKLRTYNKGE